ncbi:MAG: phage tail protein, partial [Sphingorhabdus sp.]
MATLVLTAVGSALGGPIGGAIGAALGQQIDGSLFAPAARQGSRLKELAVQTSSYGTQIPGVFGAMRVAGTVIWATDLIEERVKSGGGKGRPSTVNYSYRVSLAVALSSEPVARIGRIWADGNLIRGAGGDLKVDAQLRFYSGYGDQQPDPLLASAEAVGQCPAHRDMAYVVFEDLQLADFGNRIPSLTFEIFEREGPVLLSDLFPALSDGDISAQSAHAIAGFAAGGSNVREAIAPILDAFPVELITRGGNLVVRDLGMASGQLSQVVIAVEEDTRRLDPLNYRVSPAEQIPRTVSLRYYDPDRDYQAGVQHSNGKSGGRGEVRLELPAVLNAPSAKRLVELKGSDVGYARNTLSASFLTSAILQQPGDCFLTADGKKWHIDEIEHGFGTVRVSARLAARPSSFDQLIAVPGRHIPSADQPIGETKIVIIDCPLI